ncbi:MAG TPA: hypothetical protein VK607_20770 [Kofleriaceae bacterium]|nr:hypothetical protein [Kofleriaceae bacterium]
MIQRTGRTTGLASLVGLACVTACGDDLHPPADAPRGHDLTISLFQRRPFAAGDTAPAAFLAVQDGDGAWTALADDRGVYRARLAADRYGVAIGCRSRESSSIAIYQRTAADGLELRAPSCLGDTIQLDVAIVHVPEGAVSYVSTPGGADGGGGDATYVFHDPPGPAELFVSLSDASGRISRISRVPMFDLVAARTINIDFWLEGAAPEDRSLSVAPAGGDPARVTTSVIRPTGDYALSTGVPVGAPATYQMLPAALQQPGDLFDVTLAVGARSAGFTARAPGALAFELPPALVAAEPTMAVAPVLHPVFAFRTAAAALAVERYLLHAHTARSPDDASRDWTAELSAAWTGAGAVSYAFPDLSSVAGFSSEFALFTGPVRWSVQRTETTTAEPIDGRVTRSSSRSGTIVAYCGDGAVQPPETCDPPDGAACSARCEKQ